MTLKEQRFRLLNVATTIASGQMARNGTIDAQACVFHAGELITAVTKKLPKLPIKVLPPIK